MVHPSLTVVPPTAALLERRLLSLNWLVRNLQHPSWMVAKSCTTRKMVETLYINSGINHLSTGAGFCNHPRYDSCPVGSVSTTHIDPYTFCVSHIVTHSMYTCIAEHVYSCIHTSLYFVTTYAVCQLKFFF